MSGPRQFVLPLPVRVSSSRDDFFVSDSNRAALEAVDGWPRWTHGALIVIGPEGAGKSHLAAVHIARLAAAGEAAHVWPDRAGRHLIVEDADALVGEAAAEEALFHAFNRAAAGEGSLLLTARTPVAGWPAKLPDLRTRLNAAGAASLKSPDDALLVAVMMKLFADRQVAPKNAAEVAAWAAPRMDRSLAAASALVAGIDALSLAEKRRVDVRLAGEALERLTRLI